MSRICCLASAILGKVGTAARIATVLVLASLALEISCAAEDSVTSLLKEIDAAEAKHKALVGPARRQIVSQLEAAADSPTQALKLFETAAEAVRFDGRQAWVEFKQHEGKCLENRTLQQRMALHCNYLALTMRRIELDSAEPLAADLWDHIERLLEHFKEGWQHVQAPDWVRHLWEKEQHEFVFARHFQISADVAGIPDREWHRKAFDIEKIFDINLRPALRQKKDRTLLARWDTVIGFLSERAKAGSPGDVESFQTERLPQLLWQRGKDARELGEPQSLNGLLAILKSNPGHPNFAEWAAELRQFAKQLQTP